MIDELKPALVLQLSHLGLSCIWNIVGVILILMGMPALGPTASLTMVAMLVGFAALLIVGAQRWKWLYVLLSLLLLAGTLATIFPAFTKPPSLWLSDFWRYAGVALNSLGAVGAMLGLYTCLLNYLRIE